MKEYTTVYYVEITDHRNDDSTMTERELRERLQADMVKITKMQVFEGEDGRIVQNGRR